jgi:hypothetical protein
MLKSLYLENMKLKTSFKDWTLHILSFQIDTIQLVTMSDATDDETFEPSFYIGLSCPEYSITRGTKGRSTATHDICRREDSKPF